MATAEDDDSQNRHTRTKHIAYDMLAPSAVASGDILPIARVRILSGAFLYNRKSGGISYYIKNQVLRRLPKS